MSGTSFIDKLREAWRVQQSLVCVGLDPDPERMPAQYSRDSDGLAAFCEDIVDATHDLVCAYKPQIAYFAARGAEEALVRTIAYVHQRYPRVPVILDAKRGDIGSTAEQYAVEAFDRYCADAVTVNPYLGGDSLQPFLRRADRGVIVLCRTSNEGAADFQDLASPDLVGNSQPLYERIAVHAATRWNGHGNCALVVGATWPEQLARVRSLVGDMPLLVPGVGAQGGDVEQLVRAGGTAQGGLIVNSSRAILYAGSGDEATAAARAATLALREQINHYR